MDTKQMNYQEFRKEAISFLEMNKKSKALSFIYMTNKKEIGIALDYLRINKDILHQYSRINTYNNYAYREIFKELCDILLSLGFDSYSPLVIHGASPKLYHHIEKNGYNFLELHNKYGDSKLQFLDGKKYRKESDQVLSRMRREKINLSLKSLEKKELLRYRILAMLEQVFETLCEQGIDFYSYDILEFFNPGITRFITMAGFSLVEFHLLYIEGVFEFKFLSSKISSGEIRSFMERVYNEAKDKGLKFITPMHLQDIYPSVVSSNYFLEKFGGKRGFSWLAFIEEYWNYEDIRFSFQKGHVNGVPVEEYIKIELNNFLRNNKGKKRSPKSLRLYNGNLYWILLKYIRLHDEIDRLYILIHFCEDVHLGYYAFSHRGDPKLLSVSGTIEFNDSLYEAPIDPVHFMDFMRGELKKEDNNGLLLLFKQYLEGVELSDYEFMCLVRKGKSLVGSFDYADR